MKLGEWFRSLFDDPAPPPCVCCAVLEAQLAIERRGRESDMAARTTLERVLRDELAFLRGQVRALQKAIGAPITVTDGTERTSPAPNMRMPPWINSLSGNGQIDLKAVRRSFQREHQPAAHQATHDEGEK